jgi:hypothetical protein
MRLKLQDARVWSCSQPRRAAVGGRCLWRSNAAMAWRRCAKLNSSLTKAIDVSSSPLRIMRVGTVPAADAALAELIAKDRNFLAYQIAEVYAWRGETDKAFEWLQISLNNHDTGMLSLLIDP